MPQRQILQHFQMYTCTFFVAMPSQSPSLPFDSVQACLHGRECVHFGQQTNMWFYTYSSMLCPQRVNLEASRLTSVGSSITFSPSLPFFRFYLISSRVSCDDRAISLCKLFNVLTFSSGSLFKEEA